jgi:hypothetical protein
MGETNGRDELNVSGWGASLGLKGRDMLLTVVVVLMFLSGAYVLYAQHNTQSDQLQSKFDAMIAQLQRMNELNYLQTYQLSRPQNERLPVMPPTQLWKYLDQDAMKEKEDAKRR